MVATVDEIDAEFILNMGLWFAKCDRNGRYYAARSERRSTTIRMHQVIAERMGLRAKCTDHVDGDGLNNRRSNLRAATSSQNNANRGAQINNTSGYKGVSWDYQKQKWRAKIQSRGETLHLGCFCSRDVAARAYNYAARRLFGEFAYQNEVPNV